MVLACGACGDEVRRSPSTVAKSKSGKVFCSRSYATVFNNSFKVDEKHGNFTTGKSSYRLRAFRAYGAKCCVTDCPLTKAWGTVPKEYLDVDHKDSDRNNNHVSNLQVMCVCCHAIKTRKSKIEKMSRI